LVPRWFDSSRPDNERALKGALFFYYFHVSANVVLFAARHMSATSESIVENLRTISEQIIEAKSRNDLAKIAILEAQRLELNRQFTEVMQMLSENTQILKG
jgi:hypothetical protein